MSRRAGSAIFVLSFALVPWGLEACGRGANVLEGDLGTGGDPFDGSYSGGATAGFGGGGSASSKTTGGAGRPFMGTRGVLGPGGSPSMGGTSAGGGPATGGSVNAEIRRALIEELCDLTGKFPCLTLKVSGAPLSATLEEKQELCRQATLKSHEALFGERCFNEWYDNAVCAVQYTGYCPCDPDAGQECTFEPETHDYGPPCAVSAKKLATCALATTGSGTVNGTAGAYEWADGDFGCGVQGLAKNGVDWIKAACQGTAGGPQLCTCTVNGVPLVDVVRLITGGDTPFYAADCKTVATQLSQGRCSNVLDCCYQYDDGLVTGCSCGADPELAGFSSCAELAASVKGTLVDHCDAYRPATRP